MDVFHKIFQSFKKLGSFRRKSSKLRIPTQGNLEGLPNSFIWLLQERFIES
jgi:hypothetical protein